MTLGPLEYLVIEFEGNHFTGEILPELHDLRDRGVARIVDLIFIQKDQNGNTTVRELSDLSEELAQPFGPILGDVLGLLTPEDIDEVVSKVANNSSVALVLLEHLWAVRLREVLLRAHGKLLDDGLVSAEEVEALGAELEAQQPAVH